MTLASQFNEVPVTLCYYNIFYFIIDEQEVFRSCTRIFMPITQVNKLFLRKQGSLHDQTPIHFGQKNRNKSPSVLGTDTASAFYSVQGKTWSSVLFCNVSERIIVICIMWELRVQNATIIVG